MCGIVGIWLSKAWEEIPAYLQRMTNSLRHRGPDDHGVFIDGPVGLGNRRLSILDLEGGHQPVFNEDHSMVVVYNGEIYNYPELRSELEAKGHCFATRTDTEVLVHLYEEYGLAFPKRLRGMFAFALYDRRKQELFLARDPFGIKPLVYAELPEGFFFASELKALLGLPFFPRDVDSEALGFYVALNYIPAPWTIWKHARRLPPGHAMRANKGRVVEIRRYMEWPSSESPTKTNEVVERLDDLLQDSVRAHLLADVPVGAFLSGGLDSSLVSALAKRALGNPIRTFTISFPEWPMYNEAHYARRVAQYIGSDHEEIPVTSKDTQEILWDVVRHLDEPFADSSLVNVGLISKVAREHVKVVLSGDGGDEFFAGYNKYQGLAMAQRLTPFRGLFQPFGSFPWPERRGSWWGERVRQARKLLRLLHPEPLQRYLRATISAEPGLYGSLLNGTWPKPQRLVQDYLKTLWKEAQKRYPQDPINTWLWMDAQVVLPYDMLHKVDTASMMYSLEVRVPLVDVPLAHHLFAIPGSWKLKGLARKWLLRQVAVRYLPPEILHRPKGGFGIPIGEWMREDLRDLFMDYLSPDALRDSIWNTRTVEHLWQQHLSQSRDRFWELWNIFVFEVWRQQRNPEIPSV